MASGTPSSLASAGFAGSGSEVIAGGVGLKLTFTQTGGTNTTDSLAIGSFSTSGGGVGGVFLPGVYDLKADHGLSATTINVNYDGSFYFDFTPLNVAGVHFGPTFHDFQSRRRDCRRGIAGRSRWSFGLAILWDGIARSFAGPGSLTPPRPVWLFADSHWGRERFNQSGGTNYAGDLTFGVPPGGRVYPASLQGLQEGTTTPIRQRSASTTFRGVIFLRHERAIASGLFNQTGGQNTVKGELSIDGGGFYELDPGN